MNELLAHRGPDDQGVWQSEDRATGLAHRRLTIIDLSDTGHQPMVGEDGNVLTYNGEIYNYLELREALGDSWRFRSTSDTETILAAYARYGASCVDHLRGMFAFALWDGARLFCARDRFGIKPFYYAVVGDTFIFASEVKALVPFLESVDTDPEAFAEYLTFQHPIGEHTLFKGVQQLMPGHCLSVERGEVRVHRYWDVDYKIDWDHGHDYFQKRLRELIEDSVELHLRSDVPVGSYLSGGIDSSLVATLARGYSDGNRLAFHGKFTDHPGYDESGYAETAAAACDSDLKQLEITADDFVEHIGNVIYHLDYPVAGPGSFPQYMVSGLASKHVKVVLGGQGGDEIFGGYARYLIAYFEQCIKAAVDGTYKDGNFVVTAESIIPNLGVLREYKPLIRKFWQEGLFDDLDSRYFRLINRSTQLHDEIEWDELGDHGVFERFQAIFNNRNNVRKEAYFDSMTHFDFKCLLPALLHVEDRVSMAHGLESRVPLLDHPLIEFMATVPANIKFKDGRMKHLLKIASADVLPDSILNRRDKMGFPVPLKEWSEGDLAPFVDDTLRTDKFRNRPFINGLAVERGLTSASRFSRKLWGLLSIELWYQAFHDRAHEYRARLERARDASHPGAPAQG
jgi:asparagine synthase (glutamine-hydrolysing)